ncbi:elongation of very long chain fatty acids protein 4-like [Aphis craccivora]|uniref:Elongation of very long chain fatty acids protein 4-like n=1 Tax=Aphis craccivora TaxID=307492 RepID=A0A6G0YKQ2_APHCR|nr:elongation of very long chain fatty acids protein 4-like [Aphis craccivora]
MFIFSWMGTKYVPGVLTCHNDVVLLFYYTLAAIQCPKIFKYKKYVTTIQLIYLLVVLFKLMNYSITLVEVKILLITYLTLFLMISNVNNVMFLMAFKKLYLKILNSKFITNFFLKYTIFLLNINNVCIVLAQFSFALPLGIIAIRNNELISIQ